MNSSQAFAFNLFFPYFSGGQESASALLRALGQDGILAEWEPEAVPVPDEETNIDVLWATTDGVRTFCEVKLSEADFGKALDDDRHRAKLVDIYSEILAWHLEAARLEIAAQVGSSAAPLKRIRDKRNAEEVRKIVAGDEPPHLRLRAALASGVKPPDDLLEPAIISHALRLDDCFKFIPQLSTVTRVVEAGSALEAIRNLLRQRGIGNPNVQLARFLKLAKQWEGSKNPTSPSEKTVTQYLSLVEIIVDQPIGTTKRPSKKPQASPLPHVLAVVCRWAIKCPSVDNLALAFRCLTAAERRQGIAGAERHGDVPGLAAEVSSLRSLALTRVESAARRSEIDDFRRLLQALTGSVAQKTEMEQIIERLYHYQPRFDDAILKVLSEFADVETSPSITIRYAAGGEPKAGIMQLASFMTVPMLYPDTTLSVVHSVARMPHRRGSGDQNGSAGKCQTSLPL